MQQASNQQCLQARGGKCAPAQSQRRPAAAQSHVGAGPAGRAVCLGPGTIALAEFPKAGRAWASAPATKSPRNGTHSDAE